MSKKELGQYFTINEDLQKFVFEKTQYKGQTLLEPSFGAGHLLRLFLNYDPNYPMVCCELDTTIKPCITFKNQEIIYGDFIQIVLNRRFKTIIGNPPYVKKEKNRNLYLQFIEKSINLLEDDGELIFIVPSDFLKLTSAGEIIRKMITEGSFTDFLFPNNEKLFENSIVDVLIFRYQKGIKTNKCTYNGVEKQLQFNEGIITFSKPDNNTTTIDELFDCYVGFVSGRDEVFCNNLGKLSLLCDKDKVKNFIYIEKFPTGDTNIDNYLNSKKKELLDRKIRTFGDENWFEWGAIRNKTAIEERLNRDCIYVRTMTRKTDVAFIGKVQFFGGGLLCLVPKVEGLDLETIVKRINSSDVKQDYIYSGRFKIGQKQMRFIRV
jgi:adenine-specific DNA-methyltransferase